MTADPFKITIHMASSLDGYIAKKDNSVSWFETSDNYENGVAEHDMMEFHKTIDCYLMGSRTYEHAFELSKLYGWPYGDVPTIVLTHRKLPVDRQSIETYSGDLNKLVNERLKPNYKNVWLVGGPSITKEFIHLNLADEIRQSILPILLGDGIPFFHPIRQEKPLHLKNVTAYKNGVVDLCYEIIK